MADSLEFQFVAALSQKGREAFYQPLWVPKALHFADVNIPLLKHPSRVQKLSYKVLKSVIQNGATKISTRQSKSAYFKFQFSKFSKKRNEKG